MPCSSLCHQEKPARHSTAPARSRFRSVRGRIKLATMPFERRVVKEGIDIEGTFVQVQPPVQRWIESYQLLGGYYVDFGNDTDKAINLWKDAVDLRQENSFVEIISSKPNPIYLFVQEVNTVEELDALARDRESVHMYALMIRERILGPNHYHTIRGLLNRGKNTGSV